MTDKIIIQKRPPKSPAAAGILAGIFPGAGALYNGQFAKGALFIIIFAGLVTMQPHGGQPFVALLMAGFYIFQIIDSVKQAETINRQALVENGGEAAAGPPAEAAAPAKPAAAGSVFWGLFLMALGVIFLLANFDVIDFDRIWDYWPAAVIVIGLKMIVDYATKKDK